MSTCSSFCKLLEIGFYIRNSGKGDNSFAEQLKEALSGDNPVLATEDLATLSTDGIGETVIDQNGDWMANAGEPSGSWREF